MRTTGLLRSSSSPRGDATLAIRQKAKVTAFLISSIAATDLHSATR